MIRIKNPLKKKYILIFLCLVILIGCIAVLTGDSSIVQDHSLAILVVIILVIVILDLIT